MTSKIAVIGTGYVGLTTGACFARLGHDVICADIVPEKVERLRNGDVPIHEAGLTELVREGIDAALATPESVDGGLVTTVELGAIPPVGDFIDEG